MNKANSVRIAVYLFQNSDNDDPDCDVDLKEARVIAARRDGYFINRGKGLRLRRGLRLRMAPRAVSGECRENAPLASLQAMARWGGNGASQ